MKRYSYLKDIGARCDYDKGHPGSSHHISGVHSIETSLNFKILFLCVFVCVFHLYTFKVFCFFICNPKIIPFLLNMSQLVKHINFFLAKLSNHVDA